MNIHDELPFDNYKPLVSKPSLQQWDNYQIHDLYCDDIVYASVSQPPVEFKNFLAVERISPSGTIDCNFEAIAILYP